MTSHDLYLQGLGYADADTACVCQACGKHVAKEGPSLRGHRRNCPVDAWEPFTPGVCNA